MSIRVALAVSLVLWAAPGALALRLATVGFDEGVATDDAFGSGDLVGTHEALDAETFDALGAVALRARFDVLVFTAYGAERQIAPWAVKLAPFLALGGGIVFENPWGLDDLAPAVSAERSYGRGDVAVDALVPGLTDGVRDDPGAFANRYILFTAWDPVLHPFLRAGAAVTGLYGEATGGGRIVLSGPSVSQQGHRGSITRSGRNAYRLYLNAVRWVAHLCDGPDADGDAIADACDDCPAVADPAQADADGDAIGDACDVCPGDWTQIDEDGDGRCGDPDACPAGCDDCPVIPDPAQTDGDADGIGDVCDVCPTVSDPAQLDGDFDGRGGACDPCPRDASTFDYDGDGRCGDPSVCPTGCDACVSYADPDQPDADGDGVGDRCDVCPSTPDPLQIDGDFDRVGDACDACPRDDSTLDYDGDGRCSDATICAGCDNCPYYPNPDQTDTDGDGVGDACDVCPAVPDPGQRDLDYDGIGDACDDCTACESGGFCAPGCRDAAGVCHTAPLPDGSPCDDRDRCTEGERCLGGACVGTPVVCAADTCHESAGCSPSVGCLSTPAPNGTPCDDGDRCTVHDACGFAVCSGSPIPGCRHDPLACYATRGQAARHRPATLTDGFGAADVTIGATAEICNAADLGDPPFAPSAHLTCARVHRPRGDRLERRTLRLTDAFGEHEHALGGLSRMCVPSGAPGAPEAGGENEFACYRVRGDARLDRTVTITDAFGAASARLVRPVLACAPTARDGVPVADPGAHLVCYRIAEDAPPFAPHSIVLSGALGQEALIARRRGLVCLPATAAPCATLTFTQARGWCGGPANDPPAQQPFVGAIYDAVSGGNKVADLGASCNYFGGGESEYYPAVQSADGATMTLETRACGDDVLHLTATGGSGLDSCTFGPGGVKRCLTKPDVACAQDADCPGSGAGRCQFAPRCFGGPPVPFHYLSPGLDIGVCLLNALAADSSATLDVTTGAMESVSTTNTLVYLTYDATRPCPVCESGVCLGGARSGRPCTPSGNTDHTSLDCPPLDAQFYLAVGPGQARLSTAPRTITSADGFFCPNQRHAGAFGHDEVRRIDLPGALPADLRDGRAHPAILLSYQCGLTGNPIADQAADLPGPQALSVAGTVQLTR